MKKMSFKLLALLMSAFVLAVGTSCDDDPDDSVSTTTPVLDENFTMTIDANTVTFGSTLAASDMWVTDTVSGVTTDFVGGVCTVTIPIQGTYIYTCSATIDGVDYTSDPFEVAIAETDLTFLQDGIWNTLTGGPDGGKTWILDLKQKSDGSWGSSYHHCALDFYGDDEAGALGDNDDGTSNDWGPWGGTNIYGWGGEMEIGEISFDGTTGMATLVMTDGVNADGIQDVTEGTDDEGNATYTANPTAFTGTFTSSFSMQVENRDDAGFEATIVDGEDLITIWDNMEKYQYSYLNSLSDEIGYVKFTGDVRFPMDKGRIGEGQFKANDMKNVMIVHCSDSSLVVRIKRTYEGFESATVQKENSCWLLYNFIVKEYTYAAEEFIANEDASVNTSFTQDDLVGTWKYADVPQGWIAFAAEGNQGSVKPPYLFGIWDTRDAIVTELTSWGAEDPGSVFTAAESNEYVFNADGTCTLNGVDNTYSIADGVITFGTDLSETDFSLVWLTLAGNQIKVVDVANYGDATTAYTPLGTWFGQKNGEKDEFSAVQLVKQ